ncbi:MAG: glucuronate isomerase [Armatimonadota bacterium]
MKDRETIKNTVLKVMAETKVTDIHTHLYAPDFGGLLLWGIDDLLTYHYLVAEAMRWSDLPYDAFWALSKEQQADHVWKVLFIDHSPISESCRGVLTILESLGLDVSSRDLNTYREYFSKIDADEYVNRAFELTGITSAVMTNDPFDDAERKVWMNGRKDDPRFHAALRLDVMLNSWETAYPMMKSWGYDVSEAVTGSTVTEVRRFLKDWIDRMGALYMAVSLPPTFDFPEDSARGRLIAECVIPVAEETKIPVAVMIGVRRQVNPSLKLAGDAAGKGNVQAIERLCSTYPNVKFLATMLSRENQHELCIAARKFRNLMIFGCWWFLNSPGIIEDMTRTRFEMLGLSVIPQHSDARVLDQVIYKWAHSRKVIAEVLTEKYFDLAATGWQITEDEIRRDISDLFGGNFWKFIKK